MPGKIATDGKAPVDGSALGDLVVNTRIAIRESRDDDARPRLSMLYRVLIEQTRSIGLDLAKLDHLIIVPHGPLHYVPFPALLAPDGRFLAQQVATSVVPSASLLVALERRPSGSRKFLALAPTPPADAGVEHLDEAVRESRDAATALPGLKAKVLTDQEADLSGLAREGVDATVLHVSTHGQFPDDDAADNHFLWLSPGSSFDGRLKASAIRELDLHATGLVVLSVCNGAVYRTGPGDEPYGLVPAFLEAGASNVMGALWPIEDKFAPRFMRTFYGELAKGSLARAYQATMKAFIDKGEFIRRWAGFVLVGHGGAIQEARQATSSGRTLHT
jgi:CHAT domain-containing protein